MWKYKPVKNQQGKYHVKHIKFLQPDPNVKKKKPYINIPPEKDCDADSTLCNPSLLPWTNAWNLGPRKKVEGWQ